VNYLAGRFGAAERRWIFLAAAVLVPVFFLPVLPIWHMKLWAPQYREGLELVIYSNTIKGDLQNINTLNHYVGMHAITPSDFKEFTFLPQALTAFGFLALLGALFNRRWLAVLGWLLFTAFSAYMFGEYAKWLWRYGHELDPRAAIKLPAFTPPLIGFKQMANFKVLSVPGVGTLLLGVAWALGPIVLWLERRAARRAAAASAAAGAADATAAARVVALALALGAAAGAAAVPARAATLRVPAAAGALEAALARAANGDTLVLARGAHRGPARITARIVLTGEPGAVIVGPGTGSVLTIEASGAEVRDLALRGSGARVLTIDAAIRVLRSEDVRIVRVRIDDALYGVYAERSARLVVEGSTLVGRVPPRKEDGEGNGIHLWSCADPRLVDNDVQRFTDGVYLSFVDRAEVRGNRLHHCGRYGLHTMYCQTNVLVENRFTENVAGCAIMFSNHLRVERNDLWRNRGPRTYGLLLRDCSDGTFRDNRLVDNTVAIFMDNSNRNRLSGNLVQDNGWGLLMFSSCAGNEVAGNSFVHNDYPVSLDMRRTSNRFDDGARGNFWSENAPYDLDGDGRSDVPYSPVSAFSFLSKQYPDLAVLGASPAAAALAVAERVLPALRPSEAVDRFPRLRPAPVRGTGRPLERPLPGPAAWGGRAAFAALLAAGVASIALGGRAS
jgi:nitrous oxidase accessory protein